MAFAAQLATRVVGVGALAVLVGHPGEAWWWMGCCIAHTAHAIARSGEEPRQAGTPAEEISYVPPPPAPPPTPERLVGDHFEFTLPGRWAEDVTTVGRVYRDANRHHAVRIQVESSTETPQEWVARMFPGASQPWTQKLGDSVATFANFRGKTLRITVAAISMDDTIYALACSSDDLFAKAPDFVCNGVLVSFRVGG